MTVLDHLSPRTLRDLAAAITARRPQTITGRRLTDDGIEKLADMLIAGAKPTIGFFRRHQRPES